MSLSACAQEVMFLIMLLVQMTKVKKPSVIYEDNQGAIFLEKNRQVGIRTNALIFVIILCDPCWKKRILTPSIFGLKISMWTSGQKKTSEADFARQPH